ncbi:DUF494 family protein [Iocasia frigidifontis]|uniref:DUF494 family protein n=1 Tax=Iocasia fonsfrigidae TaxID=2682810 RepID=A0A8A7K9K2_9FIRM|nr:DUF494 family protein [Iocasia fonsfrigidae]QTL98436.1 DUF494 family protein [Iocasia fonsfrigidae]
MNEDVMEIIGLLIRMMLKDENHFIKEEEIIQNLLEEGYDIQDIDEAFELIYHGTEIIDEEKNKLDESNRDSFYNRVFSQSERMYLSFELQGLIKRMLFLNLLTPGESEEIIIRVIQDSYPGYLTTGQLWDILEEVIEDQGKLQIISSEIIEFRNMVTDDSKYIN